MRIQRLNHHPLQYYWIVALVAILGDMQTADEMYKAMLARTTVGDEIERGNLVVLWCSTCGYDGPSTSLDCDRLAELAPDMTLADLAARATFKACGHRGAWVDSRRDPKRLPKPPGP